MPTKSIENISDSCRTKGDARIVRLALSAVLAGAYIAFGAHASVVTSFNFMFDPGTAGIAKAASAAIFPVGLMLVVICRVELFTGNALMIVGLLDRKIRLRGLIKNWIVVYMGNFAGALLIALMVFAAGLFDMGDGLMGAALVKIASYKIGLGFPKAMILGILCNWVVCMAIWMAVGTESHTGKIASIFFTIGLFVISGFEHSIANMYFIPAGLLAAGDEAMAAASGADTSILDFNGFITGNLLPVTLGNIIGGVLFVGAAYWLLERRCQSSSEN